jgi:protein-S-isoprenylcysteine O-methyltransferase Ste14
MNKFIKWQNQESSKRRRLLFLGMGALVFPISIPAVLILVLPQVDRTIGLDSFSFGNINIFIGIISIIIGGFLGLWTIFAQIKLASGSPFPMMPTKKLIIVGPFKYCRNPMTLGTIIAYSGVAIWVGSYTALSLVILFASMLIVYIKMIEEKELALRFGQDYMEYKKNTPFILPINFVKDIQYDKQEE